MSQSEGAALPLVETLPNGIVLVNDYLPGRANVSISVEVFRGSRDEPEHQAGGHHFNEHVVWRGCKRFGTYQLIDDAVKDNSGISLAGDRP